MPMTPTYGFEYETPMTKPGITLTGDSDGSSPILAEQVEIALAGVDSRLASVEGDVAILQSSSPTDTGWLALSVTAAAGWTLASAFYRRWGPMVGIRVEYERTGADIVAGASGNIVGDPQVFTINTVEARPSQQWQFMFHASLTSGGCVLNTAGVLDITDAHSNSTVATNNFVRFSTTYFGSVFS